MPASQTLICRGGRGGTYVSGTPARQETTADGYSGNETQRIPKRTLVAELRRTFICFTATRRSSQTLDPLRRAVVRQADAIEPGRPSRFGGGCPRGSGEYWRCPRHKDFIAGRGRSVHARRYHYYYHTILCYSVVVVVIDDK